MPHLSPNTSSARRWFAAALIAAASVTAACGGATPEEQAAADAAKEVIANLESSSDVRDFEVLDVASGNPTTLRDVVDGDRPVLLWFFAPH